MKSEDFKALKLRIKSDVESTEVVYKKKLAENDEVLEYVDRIELHSQFGIIIKQYGYTGTLVDYRMTSLEEEVYYQGSRVIEEPDEVVEEPAPLPKSFGIFKIPQGGGN